MTPLLFLIAPSRSLLKALTPSSPSSAAPRSPAAPGSVRAKRVVTYEHGRLETIILPIIAAASVVARPGAGQPGQVKQGRIEKLARASNRSKDATKLLPKTTTTTTYGIQVPDQPARKPAPSSSSSGIAQDADGFWQQLAQTEDRRFARGDNQADDSNQLYLEQNQGNGEKLKHAW